MTNIQGQSSPYSEDWSSYRKLVVDTLKRLDDRTLDTFQRLSDLASRVQVIEHSGHGKELARLEAQLQNEINKMSTKMTDIDDEIEKINDTLSSAAGAQKVLLWVVGVGTGVIGFLANFLFEKLPMFAS